MPLLKAHHAQGKLRESPIVMDLSDLEKQAGQIVAQARAQAERIVVEARAAAQRETVQIREEARAAGHAEGLQAGLAEGRQQGHDEAAAGAQAQLQELVGRWSQTLDLLQGHMPIHVADARTDLIRLALGIAARVTRQEALRNRQITPVLAEETLRMIGAARLVALHVSPQEMELLEAYLPDLLARLRSIESVQLTPDESVGPAGCVVRFGAGEIDARLETQLDRIAQELLGKEDQG
jgi:flagellar assembly protein FliH